MFEVEDVPAFPMANAANFLACSSESEAAAMMRGRRGGDDEEEDEIERRNVSLCLRVEWMSRAD